MPVPASLLPAAPPRVVTRDDFETLSLCGSGEYGRVLMVRCTFNAQIYAMKVIAKTNLVLRGQTSIAQAIAESEILQTVRYPFIVSLHFAFQDQEHLYLVMDYAGGGDLFALIESRRTLPEAWIRMYAAEVVLAIDHCHQQGIVYRDLKPENVMVGLDGHLMLTDFGLAKRLKTGPPTKPAPTIHEHQPSLGEGQPPAAAAAMSREALAALYVSEETDKRGSTTGTICGTPSYLAPEILKGDKYGFAVDWWTVGCLIYEMATGETPFRGATLAQMAQKITAGEFFLHSSLPPTLSSLVRMFLKTDPTKRLGMGRDGAARIQQHPFFHGIDWDKLRVKALPAPYVPQSDDALPGAKRAGADGADDGGAGADGRPAAAAAALSGKPAAADGYSMLQAQFKDFAAPLAPVAYPGYEPARAAGADGDGRAELQALSLELALDGTVLALSAALLRLLKYEGHRDELVGRSILDAPFVAAAERPALAARVEGAAARARALLAARGLAEEAAAGAAAEEEAHGDELMLRARHRGALPPPPAFASLPSCEVARLSGLAKLYADLDADLADLGLSWLQCKLDLVVTSRPPRGDELARAPSASALESVGFGFGGSVGGSGVRIILHAKDRSTHERNKGLVARRYRWAYAERRAAAELASLLDTGLMFDESRTSAALAVRGGNQSKGGFHAYVARRDRFLLAFPDMAHDLLSLEVNDDGSQVVTHWAWTGTHLGAYRVSDYDGRPLVLPASGGRVACSGMSIDQCKGGRILKHSAYYDEADLRGQLMRHLPLGAPHTPGLRVTAGGVGADGSQLPALALKRERVRTAHSEALANARAQMPPGAQAGALASPPPQLALGRSRGDTAHLSGGAVVLNGGGGGGGGGGGALACASGAGQLGADRDDQRGSFSLASPADAVTLPRPAYGAEPQARDATALPARAALAMVAAACGDGLTVLDGSGAQPLVLYANRAFEAMSGYSADELKAAPLGLGLLSGLETNVAALAQLARALKSGQPQRVLLVHYDRGRRRWLNLMQVSPVGPTDGLVAAFKRRAALSAAAAAEAVADDVDEHNALANAAPLLDKSRADARALRLLCRGQLFCVSHQDLTHAGAGAAAAAAASGVGGAAAAARARAAAAATAAGAAAAARVPGLPAPSLDASARASRWGSDAPAARAAVAAGVCASIPLSRSASARAALGVVGASPDRGAPPAARAAPADEARGGGGALGLPRCMGALLEAELLERLLEDGYAQVANEGDRAETHSEGDEKGRGARARGEGALAVLEPSLDECLLRACIEGSRLSVAISQVRSALTLGGRAVQPIVYVNEGFEALSGYLSEECVGRNCRFLQTDATDPLSIDIIRAAVGAQGSARVHMYNATYEGRGFWNVLSLHPVMIRTPHAAFAATAQADATYARSEPGGDLAGSIAECAAAASRGVYVVGIQTEVSKHELADILQEAERWRRRPEPLPPILP